jgi:hypothetical protein
MAHPKHEEVRRRYGNRCGVHEEDVGGELTVDHFRPLIAGMDESDDNLVYACHRCNLYKGDFVPTHVDLANGWRVVHPIRDNYAEHIRENATTGELEALTATGRFHVILLHLNRPALIAFRRRKRLRELLAEKQRLLENENSHLREIVRAQAAYLAMLQQLFTTPSESNR